MGMDDGTFVMVNGVHKEHVMTETWGHLAPERDKTYRGYIIFCISETGDIVTIRSNFRKLPGSPWFQTALDDFAYENAKEHGVVYRFDGTFRNYQFSGKIRRIKCSWAV